MIAQHFIRSPSLREKLNDRYAGIELTTGLIITVVVILVIFFISTITGRVLLYLLLGSFIILMLCVVAIYWVHDQKRRLRQSAISLPMSKENFYVYGIRFNPLDESMYPNHVSVY